MNGTKPVVSKWLWIAVVVVILIGGAFAAWYYLIGPGKTKTATTTPTTNFTSTSDSTKNKPIVDAGVTWITPLKIDDLGLFDNTKLDGNFVPDETKYYQIANLTSGGQLILAVLTPNSPSGPLRQRFSKDAAGKYTYIKKASDDLTPYLNNVSVEAMFKSGVAFDAVTSYGQLTAPETLLTTKNYKFSSDFVYSTFLSELKNPKKVDDSVYGPIFATTNLPNGVTAFSSKALYLEHGDSTITGYIITDNPFNAKSGVPVFSLNNDTPNKATYTAVTGAGCGRPTPAPILVDTTNIKSRLVSYGKTSAGDTIYTVQSATDPIVTAAYDIYTSVEPKKDHLTIAQYFAKTPLVVWQDSLGDWEVYVIIDYTFDGGCGKPVVYLYPTKTTDVSVQVGADITKSEPIYNNGWQAIAEPSGKLTVNGKTYPYLFWEGKGDGPYPTIDFGSVVKKADLKSTLLKQLSELGLNNQERADFMAFWWPKMPSTPYVRLSWLGTQNMNRLAPLAISPKPDTLIRIFLDFQGLSQPIQLLPQHLSSPTRQGFTAVEWGGLLRNMK